MESIKRNRILLWVAIILLFSNLAILSLIWLKPTVVKNDIRSERKYNFRNKQNFEERIANELNLNEQQIKEYRDLKRNHFSLMRNIKDSINRNKTLIHKELNKNNPDINYINRLSDSIGLLNAEFEKLNYNHIYALKETLSEEQLANFKKLMENLHQGQDSHRKQHKNRFGTK